MAAMKSWGMFKRLRKESTTWKKWKLVGPFTFKWKKMSGGIKLSFFDDVLFRIVSVGEAVVLVSTLCFFYLCCGCNF